MLLPTLQICILLIFMKKLSLLLCNFRRRGKARILYDKSAEKKINFMTSNTLLHSKQSLSQCLTSGNLHFKTGKNHDCICLHYTRNESCN